MDKTLKAIDGDTKRDGYYSNTRVILLICRKKIAQLGTHRCGEQVIGSSSSYCGPGGRLSLVQRHNSVDFILRMATGLIVF